MVFRINTQKLDKQNTAIAGDSQTEPACHVYNKIRRANTEIFCKICSPVKLTLQTCFGRHTRFCSPTRRPEGFLCDKDEKITGHVLGERPQSVTSHAQSACVLDRSHFAIVKPTLIGGCEDPKLIIKTRILFTQNVYNLQNNPYPCKFSSSFHGWLNFWRRIRKGWKIGEIHSE